MCPVVVETSLANLPSRRGKVRDIYDLGDKLLLVACDRVDTISQWIQRPSDYDDQGDHALAFSKQLTRTMGMARELVRLRHSLHLKKELIIELNSQRQRLRELLAVVNQRKSQAVRTPR